MLLQLNFTYISTGHCLWRQRKSEATISYYRSLEWTQGSCCRAVHANLMHMWLTSDHRTPLLDCKCSRVLVCKEEMDELQFFNLSTTKVQAFKFCLWKQSLIQSRIPTRLPLSPESQEGHGFAWQQQLPHPSSQRIEWASVMWKVHCFVETWSTRNILVDRTS